MPQRRISPYEDAWNAWKHGGGEARGEPMPRARDFAIEPQSLPASITEGEWDERIPGRSPRLPVPRPPGGPIVDGRMPPGDFPLPPGPIVRTPQGTPSVDAGAPYDAGVPYKRTPDFQRMLVDPQAYQGYADQYGTWPSMGSRLVQLPDPGPYAAQGRAAAIDAERAAYERAARVNPDIQRPGLASGRGRRALQPDRTSLGALNRGIVNRR
jgi:hypothetical protein